MEWACGVGVERIVGGWRRRRMLEKDVFSWGASSGRCIVGGKDGIGKCVVGTYLTYCNLYHSRAHH